MIQSKWVSNCAVSLRAVFLFALVAGNAPLAAQPEEAKEAWTPLFNGKDLDGWTPKIKGHDLGVNDRDTFRVEDGVLKVKYDKYDDFEGEFGHLFYKEKFSHYRLRIEYRFVDKQTSGGAAWAFRNSGVMIHCQAPETITKEQGFPVSIEVQFLGSEGKVSRTTGNLCTPGTHVVMNGEIWTQHCTDSNSPHFPGDQWVTAEIEVHGDGIIRHLINGQKVLEYEKPQLDEKDKDAAKLIKDGQKMIRDGYIALQAESHPVEFRKVEILRLKE